MNAAQVAIVAGMLSSVGLMSTASLAGNAEGNGGDAVVCFKDLAIKVQVEQILKSNLQSPYKSDPFSPDALGQIQSVELLDLYLARHEGAVAQFTGSMNEILNDRLQVIARQDANLFGLIARRFNAILPAQNFMPSSESLVEIQDSGELTLFPESCLLVQLAVQERPSKNWAFVTFYKPLFDRLSASNQAALYLHEWVYHIAMESYAIHSSRKVQRLVGTIFSDVSDTVGVIPLRIAQLGLGKIDASQRDDVSNFYATISAKVEDGSSTPWFCNLSISSGDDWAHSIRGPFA